MGVALTAGLAGMAVGRPAGADSPVELDDDPSPPDGDCAPDVSDPEEEPDEPLCPDGDMVDGLVVPVED